MSLKWKIIIAVLIVIILAVIAYKVSSDIKKKHQDKTAKREFEQSLIQGNVNGQSYSVNTYVVARTVWNALHEDCMWGACEYEEKAVTALLQTPKPFIKSVGDDFYKIATEKDAKYPVMADDLLNLLSEENWDKVKFLFQ